MTASTRKGVPIRLTDERWAHIVEAGQASREAYARSCAARWVVGERAREARSRGGSRVNGLGGQRFNWMTSRSWRT